VLRGAGMGLTGIAAVIIGRELGAAGYGEYAWAFAWATTLALPAALGADQLLVREAAVAQERGEWARLRALLRSTLGWSAAVAVAAIAIAAIAIELAGGGLGPRREALLVALPIVPLAAVTGVAQGALLGLGRTATAVAPSATGRAAAFLALVGISVALGGLSAPRTVALQLAATTIAAAFTLALAMRALPPSRLSQGRASPRGWLSLSVPMGAASVLMLFDAQAGVLMLGALGSSAATGVYAAALLCMAPFGLVLAAIRFPLGALVARLGAAGEREQLQEAIRLATRTAGAVCFAIATVLILFPGQILRLFGDSFSGGESTLRLLAIAQLLNALCAFNGLVLIMRGEERAAMRSAFACLVLDLALCAALVPSLHARGAAIAALISLTVRNVANSTLAWRRLGLDTTVFGRAARSTPP
jgi:O-antigen/teichoic acid export membrane protein